MASAPATFQSFEIAWRIIVASVAKKPSDTRAQRKNLEFSTRSLQNTFRLRIIRVCEMKRDCRKQRNRVIIPPRYFIRLGYDIF